MHPPSLPPSFPVAVHSLHAGLSRWLLVLVLLVAGASTGWAKGDDLVVTAKVSREATTVGEPVQFEIHVDGTRRPSRPPKIQVEGLDIRYIGPQSRTEVRNFKVSLSVTYFYQVVPQRAGQFTIPPLTFQQDNQDVRTQAVGLRVEEGRGGGQAQKGGALRIAFAEITLAKKSAYIGETLPVELRLFVDTAIRWQPESMPNLEGEGFTKTKMPEPRQERVNRDGREYDVLVFSTAITPSRAGKIQVGPSDIIFHASIPRAQRNRPASPFDDDFFQDFFNNPFGGTSRTEQRKATADPVELDVRPLPAEGKPASYSGAVGSFAMTAEGSPNRVQIGDPITMRIHVVGRGNFDRVNAPVLTDPQGWRTYPPSSDFRSEDEVSYRGTKSFEMAVIAETRKTHMPQFEFSYFDPEAEKYVVLHSEPAALTVQGEPKPSAPAPAPSAAPPTPRATPAEEQPEAPATDILGLRYDAQPVSTFTPLYRRPVFWWAQLPPAAALLLLLASRLRSRPSAAAARAAALRREKSALRSRLEREPSAADFFDAAVRAIQLEIALQTGQLPDAVDASTACRSRQLSDETAASVEQIFSARAAMRYAGVGVENERLSEAERSRVLSTLRTFEQSHGRN